MANMKFKMDDRIYDIWIIFGSMGRTIEYIEGKNGFINLLGGDSLDTLGTKILYEMKVMPNPHNRADYDAFVMAICNPSRAHSVTVPFGQDMITFDARIEAAADTFMGNQGNEKLWEGLQVTITPMVPQWGRDGWRTD